MLKMLVCVFFSILFAAATSYAAEQTKLTVIYDGTATEVAAQADPSTGLWVTMADLKKATGFVVKPQGVCRDQLCFPLPKSKKADFVLKKGSISWFNLTAFAKLVKQPVAHDAVSGVWYFGKREDERGAYLASLEAPNFKLPDLGGNMHALTDYRGKKVLLITWASW